MSKKAKKLVVVESPTKAKTIRKFLNSNYFVESCMGHIRDLPQSKKELPEKYKKEEWAHLGVNINNNFKPIYCLSKQKNKKVGSIKSKLKEVSELILATDEDREGESISWHLVEVLKPKIPTKRIVFHEITQKAIDKALKEFRGINKNLVRAQETRRVLDRLVGYTLSPLLWKKVAYGLSAGRVQSVAIQMISKREHERLQFIKTPYWGLSAFCSKKPSKETLETFEVKLYSFKDQRIAIGSDFDGLTGKLIEKSPSSSKEPLKQKNQKPLHLNEEKVNAIASYVKKETWEVLETKEKPFFRKPFPPFITSTLQQAANRKLNFTSKETMDIAQKLYEKGYITYMRTDSMTLSEEALKGTRDFISKTYGQKFLSPKPRIFSDKKVKGAQEAHEAIRPAGVQFAPPSKTPLQGFELKLYDLIWKQTLASQMAEAKYKQVHIKMTAGSALFTTSGMTIEFEGFLILYKDELKGSKENKESKNSGKEKTDTPLPKLKKGEELSLKKLEPRSHETKPPPRYTEASLIQTMEKNGIGRPSTYASIISTIQQRGYVQRQGRMLSPTFTSLAVSKLLGTYLPNYVDVGFTSEMEKALDRIAEGELDGVDYLKKIYLGKKGLKNEVHFKEKEIDSELSRTIQLETMPSLSFRIGRYGAYVCRKQEIKNETTKKKELKEICASIPQNFLPSDLNNEIANQLIDRKIKGADALGVDPKSGLKVYVLTGRFGPYVQLGETDFNPSSSKEEGQKKESEKNQKRSRKKGSEKDSKETKTTKEKKKDIPFKPKRMSLPENKTPETVTLKEALDLLSLPKVLGIHPESKTEIKVGLGRFGPYVLHKGLFRSIPKSKNIFEVDLDFALDLLNQPQKSRGRRASSEVLKEWEKSIKGKKKKIQLLSGRYGPYIKYDKINVSLPKKLNPDSVTLNQVLDLVEEKKNGKNKKK